MKGLDVLLERDDEVQPKYNVNVLSRAIRVLRAFTHDTPELSLTEIATRAELSLSTALRLLSTLHHHGLILRNPVTDAYSLGYEFIQMASIVRTNDGLLAAARPIMRQVRDRLNETVILSARDGDSRVNIDQMESRHELRRIAVMGARWPLYVGAGGKAILSALSASECDSYIERVELIPFTDHTISDKAALRIEVQKIQTLGFGESEQEQSATGGHSFATAILGPRGLVLGSLMVSLPTSRLSADFRSEIIATVREAAKTISSELGKS